MTHAETVSKTTHVVSFLTGTIACTLGASIVAWAGIRAGDSKADELCEQVINDSWRGR